MRRSDRRGDRWFVRAAWAFVAYLIAVILFGAWVRITHSGAGCGAHWPTCHGEIVPSAPSVETVIEFTHRLTSGLCGIAGIVLLGWAAKRFGARHGATRAAALALLLVIFEGAIGAGLVLGELVASDDSIARAIVISLHLVNTLLLIGAASAVAWFGAGRRAPRWRTSPGWGAACAALLLGLVAVSMSGAITALGDTLFPLEGASSIEAAWAELSAAEHFLVRLRVIHPIVAILIGGAGLALGWRAARAAPRLEARRWGRALSALTGAQLALGLMNIALAAPGWMQLVHLGGAQAVWIAALGLGAASLERAPPSQNDAL